MKFLIAASAVASLILALPAQAKTVRPPVKSSAEASLNAAQAMRIGGEHQFAFQPGALYTIVTSPQRITDLALEPGETLLSVSAGDTARWIVGDARSGAGRAGQVHILVKPNISGLATNLVIMTDRRVYHVELKSAAAGAMAAASWRYPNDMTIDGISVPMDDKLAQIATGVPVEGLNFKYKISGDRPAWRPLRAFDDGRQVFIQMPDNIAATDAPPLFVTGERGPELVNYRVRGRFYVVDRLFSQAEMRLGDKQKRIVRIKRRG